MKKCSRCGYVTTDAALFCTQCGEILQAENRQAVESDSSFTAAPTFDLPSKKNNTVLWLVIIFLITALCFVSGLLIYMNISDSDESDTPKTDFTPDTQNQQVGGALYVEKPSKVPALPKTKKVSSYHLIVSDITWEDANADAKNAYGELVCINNAAEFEKICQLADENNLLVFWLGIKRQSASQTWESSKWNDGSDFEYQKWFKNEPTYTDEAGNPEEYLMAFKVDEKWYFNDSVNDVSEIYPGRIGYFIETVTEEEIEE